MKLPRHQTWIFDCDGVLLQSNDVKSRAFHELARPYGEDVADALVAHHRRHGGQSRFLKVRTLHEELLPAPADEAAIQADIGRYGDIVRRQLLHCPLVPGVRELLERLPRGSRRYVVSGGLEAEVLWALERRGLSGAFDRIYGSPRRKEEIFQELADRGDLRDAVYFGDARYDYEVAHPFGVHFVFVSHCTEFDDWPSFFESREARVVATLEDVTVAEGPA